MKPKKYYLKCPIINNQKIAKDVFNLSFKAQKISQTAKPGQFVQLKIDDSKNPLLPRPFGISAVNKKTGKVSIVYKTIGKGTTLLSQKKVNDLISITGPLGNGFWLEKGTKKIALVAGGTGIGPALFLSQAWKKKIDIYAFTGARSKDLLCGYNKLNKNCVQVFITTDDGSKGEKGFITKIIKKNCQKFKIDQIITIGPKIMMSKTAKIANQLNVPCQVSLEERMACGFGICMGCAVKLKNGQQRLVCTDGPVFNAKDVFY